jgi:hypothetical protein
VTERSGVGEGFRREALEGSVGADVFDSRGRRLGVFLGVVSDDEVAIRHDGAFVWRRRVLPSLVVARLVPMGGRRRAVVLSVEREAVSRLSAMRPVARAQGPDKPKAEGALAARLAPFVGAAAADGREQTAASITADEPQGEGGRHLLFVGSPHGYRLVEKEGPVPSVSESVSVPDEDVHFRVIKVGVSPLPDDDRECAYVQREFDE